MESTDDLGHAEDADLDLDPGLLYIAVNVRGTEPPPWLRGRLERALGTLGRAPDQRAARRVVARRHDRPEDEVLLTAGAGEAFALVARALRPRHAVCVHPSSTVPEAALRAAGHDVHRLVLEPPYVLDLEQVPESADLVVVGNPTDPTGVVHNHLGDLCREGRVVVVDESFADAVPDEPASLAGSSELPGLVVVRSLSRTWAVTGLRAGYLLAEPALVARLGAAQPSWPVSTLALTALETCLARGPVAAASSDARLLSVERERLQSGLEELGVEVSPGSQAPFLLCRVPGRPDVREALRAKGIAVRRGDTFPGLTAEHWRTAVRGPEATDLLLSALADVLA